MNLINDALQQYLDAIDSGFGLIGGDVRWLFNILLILNVVLAALFWAFSDDQVLVPLTRKILYVGLFAWLVENWAELTNVLADTFVLLGLKAGGGRVSLDVVLNPGSIADRGLTTVEPIRQAIRDLSGPVAIFDNVPEIVLLSLAMLVIILAFFFIALQMVMAILTFKLGTLAAFVLLPFSLVTHTAFIAERPLGWVVSSCVRLMLLTLVVGLGENIFSHLKFDPSQISVRTALGVTLVALFLLVLSLTASRLASDLATGTARLGALDAGIGLASTALAGAYVTRQVYSAIRSVFSATRLATMKAASALNQLRSASSTLQETPEKKS